MILEDKLKEESCVPELSLKKILVIIAPIVQKHQFGTAKKLNVNNSHIGFKHRARKKAMKISK